MASNIDDKHSPLSSFSDPVASDINQLKCDFKKMGELVSRGLIESVAAVRDNDAKKAYGVILRDFEIDSLESLIDRHCLQFLIKHTPAASNLRFVYSAAKMSSEVERVGDYAEAIARQAIELSFAKQEGGLPLILQMAEIAIAMFDRSLRAFLSSDAALANDTLAMDNEVDEMEQEVYDQLMKGQIGDTEKARHVFSLLQIASRVERVADQACNICEEVVYMTTGDVLKHRREREFKILFVSEKNAARSQVAEVLAKQLGKNQRFVVHSAGLMPATSLDTNALQWMDKKGVQRLVGAPKGLDQVLPLGEYDVLVSFVEGAALVAPRLPSRTVLLNWPLPSHAEGAESDLFEQIETKVGDLITALSHELS